MPHDAFRVSITRYASLIESMLGESRFAPTSETSGHVQVERGLVLVRAIRKSSLDDLLDPVLRSPGATIVDTQGHQRALFTPLLVYSGLLAFKLNYETLPRSQFSQWEEGLRQWCEFLEARLSSITVLPGELPAARADEISEASWIALVLSVAGRIFVRDAWTDLSSDLFGKVSRSQQSSGALFKPSSSESPEALWYHELVTLHALANFAVQTEDRAIAQTAARATRYHQDETQPDHATQHPWALFAFLWNAQTHPLADQLLHSLSMLSPESRDPIGLMLLADALYCLRLFL